MDLKPTSPEEVSSCLLLSLPPELRVNIYEYLFPPYERSFSACDRIYRDRPAKDAIVHVALLQSCRLIHSEATPILYTNITFTVVIYNKNVGAIPSDTNDIGETAQLRHYGTLGI